MPCQVSRTMMPEFHDLFYHPLAGQVASPIFGWSAYLLSGGGFAGTVGEKLFTFVTSFRKQRGHILYQVHGEARFSASGSLVLALNQTLCKHFFLETALSEACRCRLLRWGLGTRSSMGLSLLSWEVVVTVVLAPEDVGR